MQNFKEFSNYIVVFIDYLKCDSYGFIMFCWNRPRLDILRAVFIHISEYSFIN